MTAVEEVESVRLTMSEVAPEFYDAMVRVSQAAGADVEPALGELIKIRASQINRCAYCLDMHTRDARRRGETDRRLSLIAAWQEAGDVFTAQEQAALALTEALTEVAHRGAVPAAVYARAAAVFSARELAQVIAAAVTINAWNRINLAAPLPLPRR